jgi:hypothetical protein
MKRNNSFETYISSQSINSDVVITCIDAFFATVHKPTVIVTAQASLHTSDAIVDKLEEWKKRNITIFEFPSYSHKFNLINFYGGLSSMNGLIYLLTKFGKLSLHLWKKC